MTPTTFRTIDSPIGPLTLAGRDGVLTHLVMADQAHAPVQDAWEPADDGAFAGVVEQLRAPGSGLDEVPLREFVEAVRLHFQQDASHRFAEAVFGSITQSSPQGLQGQVTWPDDVIGTVLGNADGISAQSHLANVAAGNPAWLRSSDLRSLVIALNQALDTAQLDPLWKQMLAFAEQALT